MVPPSDTLPPKFVAAPSTDIPSDPKQFLLLSHFEAEDSIRALTQKTKSSKGPHVVSTKTCRRKLPLNVPSIPIDGISFHHEENAQRWKYVVQRHLADELNVSDKHQSCVTIIDLISQVWSISYHPEC